MLLLRAVLDLCPRPDRRPDRRVFEGVTADRLANGDHPRLHRRRRAQRLLGRKLYTGNAKAHYSAERLGEGRRLG